MNILVPDNIDSKFRFILIAAERAKQLQNGARCRIDTKSRKHTYKAMQEVSQKMINFELTEEE